MAEKRVQRRLAAILVADVVGYSRLVEADEEVTRVRLRSLQSELIEPRIAADGGRIVKTMGDGILVEFPSAVDAVCNALAIQTAMVGRDANLPEDRRIQFRGRPSRTRQAASITRAGGNSGLATSARRACSRAASISPAANLATVLACSGM